MESVEKFWVKEIKEIYPNIPYILVGLQSDLRDNQGDEMEKNSTSEAEETMNAIEACGYVECSARNGYNLKRVFETAMDSAQNSQKDRIKKSRSYPGVDSESDCGVTCNVSWRKQRLFILQIGAPVW